MDQMDLIQDSIESYLLRMCEEVWIRPYGRDVAVCGHWPQFRLQFRRETAGDFRCSQPVRLTVEQSLRLRFDEPIDVVRLTATTAHVSHVGEVGLGEMAAVLTAENPVIQALTAYLSIDTVIADMLRLTFSADTANAGLWAGPQGLRVRNSLVSAVVTRESHLREWRLVPSVLNEPISKASWLWLELTPISARLIGNGIVVRVDTDAGKVPALFVPGGGKLLGEVRAEGLMEMSEPPVGERTLLLFEQGNRVLRLDTPLRRKGVSPRNRAPRRSPLILPFKRWNDGVFTFDLRVLRALAGINGVGGIVAFRRSADGTNAQRIGPICAYAKEEEDPT